MERPRTKYVLERLAERAYNPENRAYLQDLLRLEKFAWIAHCGDGALGFAAGMHFEQTRRRYPTEYEAILEELCPGELARIREEKARKEAEATRLETRRQAREKAEERQDRLAWEALRAEVLQTRSGPAD